MKMHLTEVVRLPAAVIGSLLVIASSAYAGSVIATCGSSSGYRYDVGIANLEEDAWKEDAISDGATTFISSENGYDIILKDSYGAKTASEENATIDATDAGNGAYTFVVKYPQGTVVVYNLSASDGKKRKLIWAITRNGTGMGDLSGSMFVSDCD